MSIIRFLASDKPFEIYEGIVKDNNRKQNKKSKKVEESNTNILTEMMVMSDTSFVYKMDGNIEDARRYTKKNYLADIEWTFNEKNADLALAYINQCMLKNKELELWSIWQDDTQEAQKQTIRLKDLNMQDLEELWWQKWYTIPKCFTIKRY